MELTFVQVPLRKKRWRRIEWTSQMVDELKRRFPVEFTIDIAKDFEISPRSTIRKARELELEKEPDFLDKNRAAIVKRILRVRKQNPAQMGKGFVIPNSEWFRYKKGHVPKSAIDPEVMAKIHRTRNETIRRDRIRRKVGLSPLTKFKLEP